MSQSQAQTETGATDRGDLDETTVLSAYRRWAPVYDAVFGGKFFIGALFGIGRRAVVEAINRLDGHVLELGVGTGLSLPAYERRLRITGIDLCPHMLGVARERVAREGLAHVDALAQMDAGALAFGAARFDAVAVMFVITVVPHPDAVMAEIARVTRPGGEVVIVSHFAADGGVRGLVERLLVPVTRKLGWRSDFPASRVLGHADFETVEVRPLKPFGLFTLIRLRRR